MELLRKRCAKGTEKCRAQAADTGRFRERTILHSGCDDPSKSLLLQMEKTYRFFPERKAVLCHPDKNTKRDKIGLYFFLPVW